MSKDDARGSVVKPQGFKALRAKGRPAAHEGCSVPDIVEREALLRRPAHSAEDMTGEQHPQVKFTYLLTVKFRPFVWVPWSSTRATA